MLNKIIVSMLLLLTGCQLSEGGTTKLNIGREPAFSELVPQTDYVIYSDCSTLPTLYSGIHMLTHNQPSFMYMGRTNTLDVTKIPTHVKMINSDDVMRVKIKELYDLNNKATFSLYVNDLRIAKAINYFYSQGIPENQVKVIQVSDGTATYIYSAKLNDLEPWKAEETRIKDIFSQKLVVSPFLFCFSSLLHTLALDNVTFWMPFTELFVGKTQELADYVSNHPNKNNYHKVVPEKFFRSLSPEGQGKFIELVGLNKKYNTNDGSGATLNNQTIKEAFDVSPKPNIIITGTSPYSPSSGDSSTDQYIKRVKEFYGDGYDYFFKGHPGPTTYPADKSITVLPSRMPMEAMLWAHSTDIAYLGGYKSSLYMSAPQEIKKFFFAEKSDGSTLIPPLDELFRQGLLGDVKFF